MNAAQLLDSILKKKWLSSNTVREGLIACFTLTLSNYAKRAPLSKLGLEWGGNQTDFPGEAIIYSKVLEAAQDGFQNLEIDDEYPTKDQLLQLKAIMEERLGLTQLKQQHPGLMDEYNQLTKSLLDKME